MDPNLTDAEIARQLGIKHRQTIGNARLRHAEFWVSETTTSELILRIQVGRLLDAEIEEYRKEFTEVQSWRASNKEALAAYEADLEAGKDSLSPTDLAIERERLAKLDNRLDVQFAQREYFIFQHGAQALAKRYGFPDVAQNPYDALPDLFDEVAANVLGTTEGRTLPCDDEQGVACEKS